MGMQDRDKEGLKKLINNGKFLCKKCGRVANKPRNLCKPVKL